MQYKTCSTRQLEEWKGRMGCQRGRGQMGRDVQPSSTHTSRFHCLLPYLGKCDRPDDVQDEGASDQGSHQGAESLSEHRANRDQLKGGREEYKDSGAEDLLDASRA